jgi:hypothetical protein
MTVIDIIDGISLIPEAKTIIAMEPSRAMFDEEGLSPVKIGKYAVAPWGESNDLPNQIRTKAEANEVVSSNLLFNMSVAYGLGPKPMRRVIENGKVVGYEELITGQEAEFFDDNDIGLYLMEQLTDLNYFYNAFPEIILSADKRNIVSLRSKEAMFSRWTTMNAKGVVEYHLYSAKWADGPKEEEIVVSDALDDYNPFFDLTTRLSTGSYNNLRFIVPIFMPTPGRPYYPKPNWWSIFSSGWYDHAIAIPLLKNAIIKNNLGVRFIVYVSDKYWQDVFAKEGIDQADKKVVAERINKEKEAFASFLAGEKNAGKAIMATKKFAATATGSAEEKYIEIIPIKNDLSGGELLQDSEEASNIISYSMGVHTGLIGATPGKNKGNMGGTEKRELYMIKQALTKPLLHRVLRPFSLIKKFNRWDENFVIQVPEYTFTTLDESKTGKEETIDNTAL